MSRYSSIISSQIVQAVIYSKFEELEQNTTRDIERKNKSCSIAMSYPSLNRYSNILPFNSHLAPLLALAPATDSAESSRLAAAGFEIKENISSNKILSQRYINASRVIFSDGSHFIIASAANVGPMHPKFYGANTVDDFWRCAAQNGASVIVGLAKFNSGFSECADYIATAPPNVSVISTNAITNTISHASSSGSQVIINRREISMQMNEVEIEDNVEEKDGQKRYMVHLHFLAWPNYGVVESVSDLGLLIETSLQEKKNTKGTILVHCSGGVGRSGTFLTIFKIWEDYMNSLEKKGKIEGGDAIGNILRLCCNATNDSDIIENFGILGDVVNNIILTMREQRHTWMVEGFEQYLLIYKTLLWMFLSTIEQKL